MDLFARKEAYLLAYMSLTEEMDQGGSGEFSVNWNRWEHIYLFPPTVASVMSRVCLYLIITRARLLIAPLASPVLVSGRGLE